ncbi:MAG: NACHT domain-containing protein [Chloroflexi bacterium]|nr:NACHT domain-containing protein [Chloroflexota bacterium]
MPSREELLARWQRFRDGPLAQGLYRGRITVEGSRFLEKYQKALVQAVRELPVPGRTAPLDLEKVYVPIRVIEYTPQRMASPEQEAQPSDQPPARTLSVEDALRVSPHMVLLGQPGSGKSTTLKGLAWRFIRQEVPADYLHQLTLGRQGQPLERLLPILVSLPDLAHSDQNLVAFLAETLAAHFPYPHLFIAEQLQRGECLLLLDDLDKIATVEQRARIAAEIQHLIEQYPLNYVIVTSRPNGQDFPPSFRRWWVLGLDDAGIDDLVTRWYADQPEQAQAMRQAMKRNPRLRSLAANPLFLSILLVSHAGSPERPVRCAALYEGMLHILLRQEVGQPSPTSWKEQFLQELALELHTSRARSLGKGELRDRMQAVLARSGQAVNKADRLLDELISANILWSEAAGTYRLAHLAWQEYLAARRILERGDLEPLAGRVDDPWYEQVFLLLAGLQRKAYELIRLIRERSQNPPRALFLAARCLPEADQTDGQLRAEIAGELFALFREEAPELWPEAAAAIAGLEDQSVEVALLRALEAQEPALRQHAAWALGRVGEGWAVAPLIAALEDPSPHVRQRAAWALGEIRDERAIQPLIRVFSDHDRGVAKEAAQALANTGQAAVQPLIHTFSAPEEQARRTAILALSRIGVPAIPRLLASLEDESPQIQAGAEETLVLIGEPAIGPIAETLAQGSSRATGQVIKVLGRIGGRLAVQPLLLSLIDTDEAVQEEAMRALARVGAPAVQPLMQKLADQHPDIRRRVIDTLQLLGRQAVEGLLKGLESPQWEMRWRVVQTLGEMNVSDKRVLNGLIHALCDDRREIRLSAVEALEKWEEEATVEALAQRLWDKDDAVSRRAAKALRTVEASRVAGAVRRVLAKHHTEPGPAIDFLVTMRHSATLAVLQDLATSSDLTTSSLAAAALRQLGVFSSELLLQVWEQTIERLLFKQEIVHPVMLQGLPEDDRLGVLQRYVDTHPELNLVAEDTGLIRLKGFPRIKDLLTLWDAVANSLADNPGGMPADVFSTHIELFFNQFCTILGIVQPSREPRPITHGAFQSLMLDISDAVINTRLPPRLPAIFFNRRVLQGQNLDELTETVGLLSEQVVRKTALLILFAEESVVEESRQLLDKQLRPVQAIDTVVLGRRELERIAAARDPKQMLRRSIYEQMDLTLVSPFILHGPVPEHRFSGRAHEIERILGNIQYTSVALLGGRQIGKTSIIEAVNRRLSSAHQNYRCIKVNCEALQGYPDFFEEVIAGIRGRGPGIAEQAAGLDRGDPHSFIHIVSLLRDGKTLPVFLLDEVDGLLKLDQARKEILFRTFRSLSQTDTCRFICTGERFLNERLRARTSPLLNFFGVPIYLSYLDPQSAKEIIEKPMAEMNIKIRDEQVLEQITDLSSCHPRIVQVIGDQLVRAISESRDKVRELTPDHFLLVANSEQFKEEYISTIWGGDRIEEGCTALERIITLVMGERPASEREIRQALLERGISCTVSELKEAIITLVLYNVLQKNGREYSFIPKHFPRIVRESLDLELTIEGYKDRLDLPPTV